MVQNIQALRFGNTIIESLWNNRYIDNIQVTLVKSWVLKSGPVTTTNLVPA